MKTKKRKTPQGNDLRAEILLAAQRIVLEQGFDALSMRRVAEAIGYSATTIYLYFENREAIVAELGRVALNKLVAELGQISSDLTPRERLQQYATVYLGFSMRDADSYRLIFMENADLADAIFRSREGDDATDVGARAFAFFIQAFTELAAQDRTWAQREPRINAEVYWTALHGIASLKITCAKFLRTDGRDLLGLVVPSLLDGLAQVR
ncbi:MAG: TetR/AcrR family transcriptional regulator [Lacunisphaera sp.]